MTAGLVMASTVGIGAAPSTASATTPAPACAKVDKVRVVLQWVAQSQFAGYYAANDQGLYAKHCLEVEIQEGGVNIVPQTVLASGNSEFRGHPRREVDGVQGRGRRHCQHLPGLPARRVPAGVLG
ncbi:MAG: ABC transporter substrate-binding protein [Ilumatobacteraceae bacterium]